MATHLVQRASLASQPLALFLDMNVSATPAMAGAGQTGALAGLEHNYHDEGQVDQHQKDAEHQLRDLHDTSFLSAPEGPYFGFWARQNRA